MKKKQMSSCQDTKLAVTAIHLVAVYPGRGCPSVPAQGGMEGPSLHLWTLMGKQGHESSFTPINSASSVKWAKSLSMQTTKLH